MLGYVHSPGRPGARGVVRRRRLRCGAASTGPARPGTTWKPGWRTRGWPGTPCCAGIWTTARRWIGEGVEYLEPREILGPLLYLRGLQATTELAAGDWTAAEATARWVLAQQGGRGITGVHALATLARLHVRRGEAEKAASTVRELWEVAETCGLLHHVAPAASALAEHAELTGEWEAAVPPLRSTRALAGRLGMSQVADEAGYWLCRAGDLDPGELGEAATRTIPTRCAGRETGAPPPRRWEQLGCPFERAAALADADDEEALLTAVKLADDLGAVPLAARVRRRLAGAGHEGRAARAAAGDPGQPGRPHRAPTRRAGAGP